jgi:hypothetical protein
MEPLSEQEQRYRSDYARRFADSFEEPKSKEALTAYALANIEAARPLEFIGFQLRGLLPNPKWSDRAVALLLQDLRARLAVEEQRRATEVQKLTAQEGMKTLRVEKFLRLSGQVGDESALVNALPKGVKRTQLTFHLRIKSLGEALTLMGVTKTETRAAILRYATDYETDVLPLIRQEEMLNLVDESPKIFASRAGVAANDEGLRELLTRYTTSVAGFKVQRDQKLRLLNQEIGYSQNPRLDAALALLGITDLNMTLLDFPTDYGATTGMDSYARFNDPVTGEELKRKNVTYNAWLDEVRADLNSAQAEIDARKAKGP